MSYTQYLPHHRMSDLIADNFALLMMMSRFGITLGFGEATVQQVCEQHGVDTATFLAVANFISNDQPSFSADSDDLPQVDIEALMRYLKSAHSYFLDFALPRLRKQLEQALPQPEMIMKFFTNLENEVREHMQGENEQVFGYVEQLLQGNKSTEYGIENFASHHTHIDDRLFELKNILIKYYPATNVDNNLLGAVLYDIYACEQDLASHRNVEDCLFVPAVMQLEQEVVQS